MMKDRIYLPLLASLLVVAPGVVFAEMDYEYGKGLLEMSSPSFETDDLVERLAEKLIAHAATKSDGLMLKAYSCRKQASSASAEKRLKLLGEADAIYKEVAAQGAASRLGAEAQKQLDALFRDRIKSLLKAAKDKDTPPEKAVQYRAEAASTMARVVAEAKTAADAALPKFQEIHKKYKEWDEKVNTDSDNPKPVPREILEPLDKAFDDWLFADKKYVAARIDQLDCYDEKDADRKKLAEEIVKVCEERTGEESVLSGFPVILAWYYFMQGHAQSTVGNDEKATEAWQNALGQEITNPTSDQKKQIAVIKRTILFDLVKMKLRMKKFKDAEDIIADAMMRPDFKDMFESEDRGKDMLIDYAKAMVLIEGADSTDFEKAIRLLRQAIEKEAKVGGDHAPWVNQFSFSLAEILQVARERNVGLQLSAQEWYSVARGFFMMAQTDHMKYSEAKKEDPAKAQGYFSEACRNFEKAVDSYQRAISAARTDAKNILVRLVYEPKANFEMALAYVKMESFLEAMLAYDSILTTFSPEMRAKWFPDQKDTSQPWSAIKEANLELDKPKEGMLARADSNLTYVLNQYLKNSPKNLWNGELRAKIMSSSKSSGDVDIEYVKATSAFDNAKAIADTAKALKDPKVAGPQMISAVDEYVKAAELFEAVKPESKVYEPSVYQAGSCYTVAQELWGSSKIKMKFEERDLRSKTLAKKAEENFLKYRQWVAAHPSDEESLRNQRLAQEGIVLISLATLALGTRDWEKTIQYSNDYLAWEKKAAPAKKLGDVALLNKFRALVEQAATTPPPKCDPILATAEKAVEELRTLRPKDNKFYTFLLNALARRYSVAAIQSEKEKLGQDLVDAYDNKATTLLTTRIELAEDDPDEELSLEDYTRVLARLNKTRQDKAAVDWGVRLLQKFDPENKNVKLADDPKIWQDLLKKMHQVIKYENLTKWDRCKQDHAILIDYMYDTQEGRAKGDQVERRPAFDKYDMDLTKALAQASTIRRTYPEAQTLNPKFAPDGVPYLLIVEDEIDYRQKIEASRDLLSDLSLKVAQAFEKKGDLEATRKYQEIANTQIKILQELRGATPGMKLRSAELDLATGHFEEALRAFQEVQADVDQKSVLYFTASRRISECFAKMKNWPRAVEYPEFVAVAVGFEVQLVKEHWPEMREFLQECYKEGAPQNAKVKEILEKGGAGSLQEKPQDKPGEQAPPDGKAAPKGENAGEAKAGEAKKDEAKAGEGEKAEAAPAGKGGEKALEKAPAEAPKAGQ